MARAGFIHRTSVTGGGVEDWGGRLVAGTAYCCADLAVNALGIGREAVHGPWPMAELRWGSRSVEAPCTPEDKTQQDS